MAGLPFTVTTLTNEPQEDGRPSDEQNSKDWILNREKCYIKAVEGKGRGVFASRDIPAQTVIEISPVLLFTKDEYEKYGKHTLFDHYTFNWRDGRMALALGLGSLFNHSSRPNVSFSVDAARECIKYTSTRTIKTDEELSIFYGHKLWFDPVDLPGSSGSESSTSMSNGSPDPWNFSKFLEDDNGVSSSIAVPSPPGNMDVFVEEQDLPFIWKKLSLDKEEERIDDVELVQAWVVDIPDQRKIAPMLKWLKQSGLETDTLSHLKRIRRQGSVSSLLLDTSFEPPALPNNIDLGSPYRLPVPCNPALTQASLSIKNTFWPTVFSPRRKWEPERWTSEKVRWACDAMDHLRRECAKASADGDLPILAYVPRAFEDRDQLSQPFLAHDTRISAKHPLRHAALNVIRMIADSRAEQPQPDVSYNGVQYLLTGLTLFITHEPCIMCTMALLHSRVKEVFYFTSMAQTGGCGGITCIPSLKGVNHRFSVALWKDRVGYSDFPPPLGPEIDA